MNTIVIIAFHIPLMVLPRTFTIVPTEAFCKKPPITPATKIMTAEFKMVNEIVAGFSPEKTLKEIT